MVVCVCRFIAEEYIEGMEGEEEVMPTPPPSRQFATPNPRAMSRKNRSRIAQSTRTERVGLKNLLIIEEIGAALHSSLGEVCSESDRVYAYERALESLTDQFEIYKPLLQRIKQKYHEVTKSLLEKRLTMMTEATTMTAVEDAFCEMATKLRVSSAQRIADKGVEVDQLLDDMTALRVRKSELLRQIENLMVKRREFKTVELGNAEKMAEVSNNIHGMMDEIKKMESDWVNTERTNVVLEDKATKAYEGSVDLDQTDSLFADQIEHMTSEEVRLQHEIDPLMMSHHSLELDVSNLRQDVEHARNELHIATEKLNRLKKEDDAIEGRIREVLQEYGVDSTDSILTILKRLRFGS
jgi:chromosome segregation ATPase